MEYHSVLWQPRAEIAEVVVAEQVRVDLHLDRIIAAVAGDLDPYRLTEWLRRPLCDVEAVRYRQEVFADLASEAAYRAFDEFAIALWRMRDLRERAVAQRRPQQRARWWLDAAAEYVRAVIRLHEELTGLPLTSRALTGWRAYLAELVAGAAFTRLAAALHDTEEALRGVRSRCGSPTEPSRSAGTAVSRIIRTPSRTCSAASSPPHPVHDRPRIAPTRTRSRCNCWTT
ncbi:hypothetical protein [Nocardia sp. alder85J]|uniref:hypothetical protein n=1 Tax=Nocardia sp. alder85J TaxID=2862949 RepID=UPI001CD279BD|nr:hypothetical protein [Nocardia sp. alder85J]MCX4091207.1 hypothetical protein [Nocardia sp. alder85J]